MMMAKRLDLILPRRFRRKAQSFSRVFVLLAAASVHGYIWNMAAWQCSDLEHIKLNADDIAGDSLETMGRSSLLITARPVCDHTVNSR